MMDGIIPKLIRVGLMTETQALWSQLFFYRLSRRSCFDACEHIVRIYYSSTRVVSCSHKLRCWIPTHFILFISRMSRDTMVRFSSLGHMTALVTLVPPPKGMMTTLCLFAAATMATTCS